MRPKDVPGKMRREKKIKNLIEVIRAVAQSGAGE
jgi:hypothetical protein